MKIFLCFSGTDGRRGTKTRLMAVGGARGAVPHASERLGEAGELVAHDGVARTVIVERRKFDILVV